MTTSRESLVEDLFDRLVADRQPDEVVDLVLAALDGWDAFDKLVEGVRPARPQPETAAGDHAVDPVEGVYLAGITATGFRGIGATASLPLDPGPGLTVVIGANGSGKSSFAEALEVALLGSTHRFRSRVWRDGWRNVHHQGPSLVEVAMHVPGRSGLTRLARRWDGTDFEVSTCSVQPAAGPSFPPAELGWDGPLTALPPICASGEIEALLEREPSKLHDRLAAVLGLEQLDDAIALLKERQADVKAQLDGRDRALRLAREAAAAVSDERAEQLGKLLRKRPPPLDEIEALASGAGTTDPRVAALEALSELDPIDLDAVSDAVGQLGAARAQLAELDTPENREASRTLDLLQWALDVHAHTDGDRCPVCGTAGVLDDDWRARTTELCEELRRRAERLQAAARQVGDLLQALSRLSQPPAIADPGLDGLDVAGLRTAWDAWHHGVADLEIGELEHAALALEEQRSTVVEQAERELAARQSAWFDVVKPVADYLTAAKAAQPIEPVANLFKTTAGWLDKARVTIRNERVASVRSRARELWGRLRQQSSVELQDFQFSGTGNRRHVTFDVVVDGTAGQALGVMSQGELNALALSVFLPRATQPESPFRFVVIDDPIQAMDPAKVEGLAQVLDELAVERQVLVFTHDLRLVDAIVQLGIDATVLRVDRSPGSAVAVRPQSDAVGRLLEEAGALAGDPDVPIDVARLVSPNLCRQALETALARNYRRTRHNAGDQPGDIEAALRDAKGLYELAALGLFEDATKHNQVLGRLNNRWGPAAADTFKALNQSGHIGLHSNDQVIDLVDAARKLIGQVAA